LSVACWGALASLFLLTLSSCGGENEKERFTERAYAICGKTSRQLRALGNPALFTEEDFDEALRVSQAGLRELRTLTPPMGDEETVERILDLYGARNYAFRRLGEIVGGTKLGAAVAMGDAKLKARAAAEEYGFDECGRF
jgi:hypothetical protein